MAVARISGRPQTFLATLCILASLFMADVTTISPGNTAAAAPAGVAATETTTDTATDTVRVQWRQSPGARVAADTAVTFEAKVASARTIRTKHVMINVRDENDKALPTGLVANAVIGSKPLTLKATRTFAPGTYRYRVGYQGAQGWVNVGAVRTFTVAPPAMPPGARKGHWVMGYYVGYLRDAYPLEHVDWSAMTHVAVGAAVPRADGSLDTSFYQESEETGRAWARSVVQQAHRHGRKAILMIGGAHSREAFAGAADAKNRRAFVGNILSTAKALGFDGVDIDWEPMAAADGPNVLALGRELKARRPGIQLTIPVSPVNINLPNRTVFPFTGQLGSVYDQVNIMTYGMNGDWEGWSSWHGGALHGASSATPTSVDSSVDAFLKAGVPAKKLGIGIGFFGSCMTGATGPRQSSSQLKIVADDNVMSFANIMTTYYRPELARWDDLAKVPYLSSSTPIGPAGCTLVTYEDRRSVAAKATYARSRGLGGAIVWNINEDRPPASSATGLPPGSTSLLSSVGAGFLR